jgi:imidazolonepropionase-like amidohydrolase
MKIALTGARLLDGTGREPVDDSVVVIDGDSIMQVGESRRVTVPSDAHRVDIQGKVVMPGMIDVHTHLYLGCETNPLSRLRDLTPFTAIRAAVYAQRMLEAGFTSIRDLGSWGFVCVALKRAIEAGLVPGPRMLVAGHAIYSTGGHLDLFLRPEIAVDRPGEADGPDEVRRAARSQLRAGADVIKLMVTGGILSSGDSPDDVQMTIDEMSAAVEVARGASKTVSAHAHGTKGIKDAISAGADTIEHGTFIDDEGIEMMLERDLYLVPTFVAGHHLAQEGLAGGVPAYAISKLEKTAEARQETFQKALAAGVKIALGTDCGTPFNEPGKNALELELLVANGMSPMQALVAATRGGAEVLGLSDRLGTLEKGKLADLLVTDCDPLADIAGLCDRSGMALIMKAGSVVGGYKAAHLLDGG